jgi:ELWxxDGT repeat protein
MLVADINPGPDSSAPQLFTDVDGVLFFVADDGLTGAELWRSDGTAKGTRRVRDIAPGSASSGPTALNAAKGKLYFQACRSLDTDCEPWQSDGTSIGTQPIADIAPGIASSRPQSFVLLDPLVLFSADDGSVGEEVWVLPTAASCVGDCSADGRVSIAELVRGTNIALGLIPVSECSALDPDIDGRVTVSELIAAVDDGLNECASGARAPES